jgi:hypothetical protein
MDMVLVPGGEADCPGGLLDCDRHRIVNGQHKIQMPPFYVGRFPVTCEQWWALRGGVDGVDRPHHPITGISLQDARTFCAWTGLRLLSEREWRWAAFGPPRPAPEAVSAPLCPKCHVAMEPIPAHFPERTRLIASGYCKWHGLQTGLAFEVTKAPPRPPRFPWGDAPPSEDRCVWAGHRNNGPAQLRGIGYDEGRTAPVLNCEECVNETCYSPLSCAVVGPNLAGTRLVPARPKGASWCGAHDIAGNVWELVDPFGPAPAVAMGGSFRSPESELGATWAPSGALFSQRGRAWQVTPRDDVGFRVALDARREPS